MTPLLFADLGDHDVADAARNVQIHAVGGRYVVVFFIVIMLIRLSLSLFGINSGAFNETTLVDRHIKDIHRNVQMRVYYL
jgi:hypothetical protein